MKRLMLSVLCSGGALMAHAGHDDVLKIRRAKQNIREAVSMVQDAVDNDNDYGRGRGDRGRDDGRYGRGGRYDGGYGRDHGHGRNRVDERIFVAASYKLKMAKTESLSLPYSNEKRAVISALDTSVEKILDTRLNPYQRVDLLEDCAEMALENLDEILDQSFGQGGRIGSLESAINFVNVSVRLARHGNEFEAEDSLLAAKSILRKYPRERSLLSAMNAIDVSLEKLRDRRLAKPQKIELLADCAQQFERFVEDSDAFRRENRGGRGGHDRDDRDHGHGGRGEDWGRHDDRGRGGRYFSEPPYRNSDLRFENDNVAIEVNLDSLIRSVFGN